MFHQIVEAMARYQVVLEPDEDTPEWWAGAPSVTIDEGGVFTMAARMREGSSPRGLRGYEIRILRSRDGRRFEPIGHMRREDAGVPGFERPAIVRDSATGLYRLYGCAGLEGGWAILRFDDVEDPARFEPRSARTVLAAAAASNDGFARVAGYKDPFVIHTAGCWHLFVIGYDRVERPYHFVSGDGEQWEPAGDGRPILESAGWHNFCTRPASIVPLAVGCLFVYEGADIAWRDPVYNIATGLAYSPDLSVYHDLTAERPLLVSTTPGDYHTWRYSHWMVVGDQVYAYAEVARANNTNEIRLGVFDAAWVG